MSQTIELLKRRLPDLVLDESDAARAVFERDSSGIEGARPLAVARLRTAAEVQPLVAVCRESGIPLVPVSSVGEHHRGDTTCAEGAIVVDLSALSRIVRIDRRNRVAIVEPGVTFAELVPALAAQGLRPMLPLGPRPGKSVLAAALEREATIYPRFQWDASDPLLCAEVVFGTGELFRTGSAAGPGSLEEQWRAGDAQKNPMGPGQSDLVRVIQGAQGSIGIVTWVSIKCEPLPVRETLHLVASPALEPLVRIAYTLLRRGHVDLLFLADGATLCALGAADATAADRARSAASPWYLVSSIADGRYFPDERRRFIEREVGDALRKEGLEAATRSPAGSLEALHERLSRPDLHAARPWWKKSGRSATRELFFQTTLDRAPALLAVADRELRAAGHLRESALVHVQPQLGGRVCHVEIDLPHDASETPWVGEVFVRVARALAAGGAFSSRPYGPLAPIAFARASTASLVPRIQRLFDPDRILAPGRFRLPEAPLHEGGPHAVQ
ncbi:4-cresol dehydrogenase [hydroxylating] flavoprotein subunit [Myxococcaceae bacterium]|jgi:FAD/FMN-containing dehydrogenase|nr:4-cresol dehydrogenase [hydroxylating] flavoprotein subunit [Myxococcaceae bacterium]